jgi:hypothetical protein
LESLRKAVSHRRSTAWQKLTFATNGQYTAPAREEVIKAAAELGLSSPAEIDFLGPEYWEECCGRNSEAIKDRFYYRVTVGELEVIEALRKARYYPRIVSEYANRISNAGYRLIVTNNRTPVELDIPFAPDLTIENCLDAAKELLGLSLEWTSFADLNTSAGPSVSITIDRHAQPFAKKLSEIGVKSGDKLELWIKIVWRDGSDNATPSTSDTYMALRYALFTPLSQHAPADRGQITISRKEALLQAMIWRATSKLASSATTGA